MLSMVDLTDIDGCDEMLNFKNVPLIDTSNWQWVVQWHFGMTSLLSDAYITTFHPRCLLWWAEKTFSQLLEKFGERVNVIWNNKFLKVLTFKPKIYAKTKICLPLKTKYLKRSVENDHVFKCYRAK